jgi:Flp pilus assembly protein protease CpaA
MYDVQMRSIVNWISLQLFVVMLRLQGIKHGRYQTLGAERFPPAG